MATPTELLWLLCDDNAANTTVLDNSGNGYHGTLGGGHTTQQISAAGKVGTSLALDGSADYVSHGDLAAFEFGTSSDFSITAWLKPNGADELGYIVSKTNATTGWGLYWSGDVDKMRFIADGGGSYYSNAVFSDNGSWVHAAIVASGGSATFYRNGVAAGTVSGYTISTGTAHNVCVGQRQGGSSSTLFAGNVDDLRIYAAALTTDQLAAIYNGGSGTDKSLAQLMGTGRRRRLILCGAA